MIAFPEIKIENIVDAEEAEMIIQKGVFEQPKVFIMFEISTVVKMKTFSSQVS